MVELVYLSEAKLEQFVELTPSRWRNLVLRKITVSAAAGGNGVALEAELARSPRLRAALQHIEEANKWYQSETVAPGDWVFFDTKLEYIADPQCVWFFEVTDSTSVTRLVLHGSSVHLRGNATIRASSGEPNQTRFLDCSGRKVVTMFEEALAKLNAIEAPSQGQVAEVGEWMAGPARVTARLSSPTGRGEVVLATPLYIQRVRPPSGDSGRTPVHYR